MTGTTPISELFAPEPYRWEVRGDPWLWKDMQQRLGAVGRPATEDELVAIIEARSRS